MVKEIKELEAWPWTGSEGLKTPLNEVGRGYGGSSNPEAMVLRKSPVVRGGGGEAGGGSALQGTCTCPGGLALALAFGDKQGPCALDMAFYCGRTAGGSSGQQ